MISNSIIVRYGEISLKGKNRLNFERKLKSNIEDFLKAHQTTFSKVVLKKGRIYIRGIQAVPQLENVFGIYSFSPAKEIQKDLNTLKKDVLDLLHLFKNKKSFRISCQRIDKSYGHTSIDIEKEIGEIVSANTKIPVNLTDPSFNFHIEIGEDKMYVFTDKINGFGGLPYGSAGKLVSLISSGIDSPVATFLMMKRGVEPVLIHFKLSEDDFQKVLNLKKKLEEYSSNHKIEMHIIDRDEIFGGKFDTLYNNDRYHPYICLLCKHLMHKKAGEIAKKERALGIVTGDNLAQVASQTLKNLYAYRTVSEFPVYSPLISFDKEKTIEIAKRIGTYDISILKSKGCTPPRNPKTGVTIEIFHKILKETGLL